MRCVFLILFVFVFSLASAENALAVGILGSNDFFIFEPNINKTYNFGVLSNTDRPMDHGIGFDGDLAPYAKLSTTTLKDLPPNEVGYFSLNLALPDELPPGMHSLTMCVLEMESRGGGGSGSNIGTRAAVCLVIKVLSLYPEKLAEFDFYAPDVALGEIAEMRMDVRSLTLQNMTISGDIDIYSNSTGNLVKVITLMTEERELLSGKSEKLYARLNTTNLEIGKYIAKATLHFDENSLNQEKTFNIGNLSMNIVNFTDLIYKSKVNKIDIYVKSRWNSEIKEVYAEIIIKGKNQTWKASSSTEAFAPWETKPLNVFFDANNISVGDYPTKVILHYEGKTEETSGLLSVREKIEVPNSTIILVIVILLLIILFIILIVRTRKKMKELERGQVRKNKNEKTKK